MNFPLSLTVSPTTTREWLSMMEDLPLDTNNPRVRDYLALIRHVSGRSPKPEWSGLTKPPCAEYRLQVLTPLSLLVNITAVLVCSIAVTPGIRT